MLKINVNSLKAGIKELSKFKSKESFMNLCNNDSEVYLTKVCINDEEEVVTYKLDATFEDINNYQLTDNFIKAVAKIGESEIEVSAVSDLSINVKSTKRSLDVSIGEYKFNDSLLKFETDESFTTTGEEMKVLLQVVEYAAKDDTRPVLQGINFRKNKVAAMDSYRLAIRECSTMNLSSQYTVPSKVLKSLTSVMKKGSSVSISFNSKTCKIELNNLAIYTRLLEEEYFKYEQLVPVDSRVEAVFDKEELKKEVDFLLTLADSNENSCMKFEISKEKTSIRSKGAYSTSTIELDNVISTGDILIAFNTNFISEMLTNFNDKVSIKLNSCLSPIVCESADMKGLDLILPMRIFS